VATLKAVFSGPIMVKAVMQQRQPIMMYLISPEISAFFSHDLV
jgi:hypothetical protein